MPIPEDRNSRDHADAASLYIGLMSGTSMDGIDAVLLRLGDYSCDILATHQQSYPEELRTGLALASRNPSSLSVDTLGSLDHWVAECFSSAASTLLSRAAVDKSDVVAIGSHGQTVRHQPRAARPFTHQIGDPNIIAARTGITTVADFRRRDLALGGEGAPLAPAFHQWVFADHKQQRAVLNIGGIANLTILAADCPTIGFDTGPGNTLLDAWIYQHKSEKYDAAGAWANSGDVSQQLLEQLLADPYFSSAPPKSTGFEYFNLQWLQHAIDQCDLTPTLPAPDIQATLTELTARSIGEALKKHASQTEQVLVCGGGVHNDCLMSRIAEYMSGTSVSSTAACGLDPDWVEAAAFAWLAMRTLHKLPGNLPTVTGASHASILGGIFLCSN